ncbi:MAG: hypothetical protein AAFR55_01110 [Pseudomonadota bacterium]
MRRPATTCVASIGALLLAATGVAADKRAAASRGPDTAQHGVGITSSGDDEAEMLKRAWAERQARRARASEARRAQRDGDVDAVRKAAREEAERRDVDALLRRLKKRSASPELKRLEVGPPKARSSETERTATPAQADRLWRRRARRLVGVDPGAKPLPPLDRPTTPTPRVETPSATKPPVEIARDAPQPATVRVVRGTPVPTPPDAIEPRRDDAAPDSTAPSAVQGRRARTPWRAASPTVDQRVTILMVIEPGSRGIRRVNKTADPILCIKQSCYISQGAARTARDMKRRRAFGTFNTLGKRSGACRNTRRCVFRGIPLGATGRVTVQPVDMRLMRHDRRERRLVEADTTCRIVRNALQCQNPVEAETYTLWAVPERVAQRAGRRILHRALGDDLTVIRNASVTPRNTPDSDRSRDRVTSAEAFGN